MDCFKPALDIEVTNKYDKAKLNLIKAMNMIRELTDQEQRMLATELFGEAKVAAVLNLLSRR